jgi:hypothetical protein
MTSMISCKGATVSNVLSSKFYRFKGSGFTVQGYFWGCVRALYAGPARGCNQLLWILSEQLFGLDVNPDPLNPEPLNGLIFLALFGH